MPSVDENRERIPVNVAVLTVSSTRTTANDRSGNVLVEKLEEDGHRVVYRALVRDAPAEIQKVLQGWIKDPQVDVVLSTGGTGLTGSDVTPEVFESLYDKPIPGFGELFRMLSYQSVGASTMQSRATGGVSNGTYMFALPGSPGACKDAWEGILRLQLDSRYRPCNLVELMPRLKEPVAESPAQSTSR